MKIYIVLPGYETVKNEEITMFNFFGSLWKGYNKYFKVSWTPETLIQAQHQNSYLNEPCYGYYAEYFTDKETAYRRGEIKKSRNDGAYGYDKSGLRFSDDISDIVNEKSAPLILSLDAHYQEENFSFVITQIDEADFYSEYNRIRFTMHLDQLNPSLRTIPASKILGDTLLNNVNEKNHSKVRRMLNEKWVRDSCNHCLYQMEVPEALKTSHPDIYNKFIDNSYEDDGGVSRYDVFENTNGKAPILYQAILNQDTEMVHSLLESGARVDVSYNGFTPIALATDLGAPSIIKLIASKMPSDTPSRRRLR